MSSPEDRPVAMMTLGELIEAMRQGLAEMHPPVPRLLLRPAEFGDSIGVSDRKVYNLIKRGLPHIYVGNQPRIPAAEALGWLREHGSEVA